jgi:hypothetical protein
MKSVIALILISSLSWAYCIIGASVNSPQNLGSYTVNTSIPINLSVYDMQSGASITTAIVNVSFLNNNTLVGNLSVPYQNGFYNASFTPVTTGSYEVVFNVSNSSCSNFSSYMNLFVFGGQSISVPDTNVFVILLMFILVVGCFKWSSGLKSTRLRK